MFGRVRARFVAPKAGLCAALLCSTAMPAFAADVAGRVVDPKTGAALPGATVSVDGRSVTAGDDGRFVLRGLPAGPVELTLRYVGYPTATRSAISSDTPETTDFALDPAIADVPGDIIVTGARAAERRALQAKRASNVIQDSLNANDVGKLPDQNVAEAVRRLPGISVANDQGEGRYVIIRGANPNLANVTVNGQTAPAPEPEGRQVKLDDIPSSLIGSVTVVKSLTPDRDANAIAGQVDIDTLTAFDRKGAFANGRYALGYNELNGQYPKDVDLTAGTTFGANREFGAVLSGNYSIRPIESENLQGSSNWIVPTGGTRAVPDDFRLRDYNLTRERYGLVGNFDYRPSSDVNLFVRTLYSTFKDHETRDQVRIEIPQTVAAGNGTAFNARSTRFLRLRNEDDSTFTIQGGGKFRFGNGIQLEVDGTYSKALKKDPLRSEFSFRTGSSGVRNATLDLSDTLFKVNPSADFYDMSRYSGYRVNYDTRRAVENLYQGRVDLTIPLAGLDDSSIKLGGKYLQRDKTNNRDFLQYTLSGTLAATGAAIANGLTIYDGRYAFGPQISYDIAQNYYTVTNPGARTLDVAGSLANSLVNDYDLSEKIVAGYAMGTFKFDRLTLIPGVRVEHIDGTYKGKSFTSASTAAQGFNMVNKKSRTDFFPGINARYDAGDRLVLRAAATTAIGRPNYADLAPYVSISDTTPGAGVVAQGNPNLKPYKAVNGDLSVEYYLPGQGIVSIAGFYKRLDNPIYTVGLVGQAGTFGGTTFTSATVTMPVNADSAELYGVELNVQAQLLFLPAPFDGLGVSGNFTYTDGEARGIPGRAAAAPNFLQSKYTGTAQLFYEKGKVAARVAYTYRSKYLDTAGTTPATDQYTDHNDALDVRLSYAFLKQFTIFAEGSNLLDSPWRRFQAVPNQLIENERYSQSYRFGVQIAL